MIKLIEFTDNTRAYTLIETAEKLGVVVPTVRLYLKEGTLVGMKYKRQVYIHEEEIERFLEERSRK